MAHVDTGMQKPTFSCFIFQQNGTFHVKDDRRAGVCNMFKLVVVWGKSTD